MIAEFEDEAGAVGKSLQGRKNAWEVDVALSQAEMGIVTAIVVLQVDVLK
jgi:hypothetical protein